MRCHYACFTCYASIFVFVILNRRELLCCASAAVTSEAPLACARQVPCVVCTSRDALLPPAIHSARVCVCAVHFDGIATSHKAPSTVRCGTGLRIFFTHAPTSPLLHQHEGKQKKTKGRFLRDCIFFAGMLCGGDLATTRQNYR